MKYYISCVKNNHGRLKAVASELDRIGHICVLDWWNAAPKDKSVLAFNQTQAIETAELYLCMLPMSHNTALELGIALSSRCGKRIVVWSDNPGYFEDEYVNTYIKHPSVSTLCCPFPKLIEFVQGL